MGHPNGRGMFSGGSQKSGKDAQIASHVTMKLGAVHQACSVPLHGAPLALTSAHSPQTEQGLLYCILWICIHSEPEGKHENVNFGSCLCGH